MCLNLMMMTNKHLCCWRCAIAPNLRLSVETWTPGRESAWTISNKIGRQDRPVLCLRKMSPDQTTSLPSNGQKPPQYVYYAPKAIRLLEVSSKVAEFRSVMSSTVCTQNTFFSIYELYTTRLEISQNSYNPCDRLAFGHRQTAFTSLYK